MIIDARGLACPLPVVNTKKAIEGLDGGEEVTVLVDNEIAVQNLQKFAKQRNLPVSGRKKADREYEVTITVPERKQTGAKEQKEAKGQTVVKQQDKMSAAPDRTEQADICYGDSRRSGLLVVLSANAMGTGDEKLGKALMKAFIFALTKQDVLPETVLLYNSGAWLSCEGSESLEDLKDLEAEGVTIMTCGTCLDFYGLKDKLAVGTVTNMYEIVEQMEQAKQILRP